MTDQNVTYKDLLPEKTFEFEYSLDENRLKLTSTTDHRIEFELTFSDQPPGQHHHLAHFLFDMWGAGFNKGREYQDRHPEEEPPSLNHPIFKELDRAVKLHRNAEYQLEGPCPSCGGTVTVSVDTLYSTKRGSCPTCHQSLAYHAPDGTYRTDVVHPSDDVRRIDIRHYCVQCRYEIPFCQCAPPVEVPDNYAEKSRHHWERPRNFEEILATTGE